MTRSSWPSSFVLDMADPCDPCPHQCTPITIEGMSLQCLCFDGPKLLEDAKQCSRSDPCDFANGDCLQFCNSDENSVVYYALVCWSRDQQVL